MLIQLDGILSYLLSIFTILTVATILILGTFILWNYIIWDILVSKVMGYFKVMDYFFDFCTNRRAYKQFVKYKDWLEKNKKNSNTDEYILCAAIMYNDTIIAGYRHADCYNVISALNPNPLAFKPLRKHQGFLTSKNRFVDRKEAWNIAYNNRQIKYGLSASDMGEKGSELELISENLY